MKEHKTAHTPPTTTDASRREFLRLLSAGAVGVGAAGLGPIQAALAAGVGMSDTNPVPKPNITFAKTVTLDVSPEQNIDEALREAVADDTLVRIPEGAYKVSKSVDMPEKAGIEGIGRVTLKIAPNKSFYHVSANNRILYVNNLHYDCSEPNNSTGIRAYVSEKGYVGHVTITGVAEAKKKVAVNGIAIAARDKDAVLMLEKFSDLARGTGSHVGQRGGNGRMGIWSGNGYHEGLAYLKNCSVVDVANNGIYASNLGRRGRLHVNGGVYKHNYGAGVRTGGNGSIIENVYIEVDMRKSKRDWWGAQPAIRWEVKGKSPTSEGLIRNCDIRMINGRMGQGIRLQRSAAKVRVENCRVQIEDPGTTPLAAYGTGPDAYKVAAPDEDRRVYIDGLQVSGSAAKKTPSITIGEGRDGSVVKNCFVPGGIESKSKIITKNNVERMGKPPARPS